MTTPTLNGRLSDLEMTVRGVAEQVQALKEALGQ